MQDSIDSTARDVPPASSPAQAAATESAADGQPPGDGREQGAPREAEGTEQKAAAAQVHPPSPVPASRASAQQDRYDYDRTSIILVAHFRPVSQDGQPRQVWLSAQNGVGNEQDFPLYRVLSEADLGGLWPPAVAQLLEDLRQDLPARRQRYEARQATKPAPTAAPSSPARHQAPATSASTRQGKAPATPTPVPTTAAPIPKQELGMAGLFEGLE
jgi:hypothetical protein